ncbi:AmmeMemoRadiSam system radical SAM enzyme [Natronoglycomyces albus]|uniref:AmmeMemoRadiSam system radical SAM enzyme n=1 Tax=Natronoglycomyces albus TaxID=2811108 RepID=A0A895XP56_9ACTN|nr:AmmeMemoRadiSam system radical SAM enzyme [Natronoglycomyces albus]
MGHDPGHASPVPPRSQRGEFTVATDHYRWLDDGRLECTVCPRACRLNEGQRGLCFVRARQGDELVLTSYGRSSGFCVDPIEKKPLNHFLPGTPVLSFGTAGCNLACRFCQNWESSKSRQIETLSANASPQRLALEAHRLGCASIAFTYNDPTIFLEYAIDTAIACRERGIKSVAVSAGYMNAAPRAELYAHMDAANIDLKGFTESFYKKVALGSLASVLETLEYLRHETNVWLEITTLLIEGYNDADAEVAAQCAWIADRLGPDVPLHFSAFHPDFKMRHVRPTSAATLLRARTIALGEGLRFVYTGNVHEAASSSTYCPGCQSLVIERDWHVIGAYAVSDSGACLRCGYELPGVFAGPAGSWGARRLPVRFS